MAFFKKSLLLITQRSRKNLTVLMAVSVQHSPTAIINMFGSLDVSETSKSLLEVLKMLQTQMAAIFMSAAKLTTTKGHSSRFRQSSLSKFSYQRSLWNTAPPVGTQPAFFSFP